MKQISQLIMKRLSMAALFQNNTAVTSQHQTLLLKMFYIYMNVIWSVQSPCKNWLIRQWIGRGHQFFINFGQKYASYMTRCGQINYILPHRIYFKAGPGNGFWKYFIVISLENLTPFSKKKIKNKNLFFFSAEALS